MEEDIFMVDNMEIHKSDGFVNISINPKLHPLEVVYATAYIFLDKTYVIIDGDPKEEIIIQLKPKDANVNVEILGREFNNELVVYMDYMYKSVRSQHIRERIVQRAMSTNSVRTSEEDKSILDEVEASNP